MLLDSGHSWRRKVIETFRGVRTVGQFLEVRRVLRTDISDYSERVQRHDAVLERPMRLYQG
jgi:hypothetical protein